MPFRTSPHSGMPVRISYWVLPIFSGLVWLGTLLGLWLYWVIDLHKGRFPSMSQNAKIPYISNVGAHELKPLFITGCAVTTVFFDLSFAADRWLRHRRRLAPNTSRGEKVLKVLTIVFAVVGTVGLILLSVFDTWRHNILHNSFLGVFIGGYILSAVFICWEYQLLRVNYREYPILRTSFGLKLFFIVFEVALCIAFGVCSRTKKHDAAAIIEWIIAVVFSFYIFSFSVDLWPAMHTKEMLIAKSQGLPHSHTRPRIFKIFSRRRDAAGPMEMEEARIAGEPERFRTAGSFV